MLQQPSTLNSMKNEYQTRCDDALCLESKGTHDSLHLWTR